MSQGRLVGVAARGMVVVLFLVGAAEARGQGGYRIDYATLLGGSEEEQLREVIPCADGTVLVGGQTFSDDFPTTPGALQPKYGGEKAGTGHPGLVGGDCFVARLDLKGGKVVASTYFGGSRQERNVYGMALDRDGKIVITSTSRSRDIPTTPGVVQPKFGGGAADWVVAKLEADLKKVTWCTYLGGKGDDTPRGGLAMDRDDGIVLIGPAASGDFPVTPGAYAGALGGQNDLAIVKLKADGSGLVYGARFGGSAREGALGAAFDREGNLHFIGHTTSTDLPVSDGAPRRKLGGADDVFLAGLSADGARLLYCTYLGGKGAEFPEHKPHVLADGSVLVSGVSGSADLATTAGAYQAKLRGKNDCFLAKLAPDRKAFAFCTFFGGSGTEFALMPTPDAEGNIWVVGTTTSTDLPVTADAFQKAYGGGGSDGFVAAFSPDGSRLVYASYLGGSGDDLVRALAIAPSGDIYLGGNTSSPDFVTTADAIQKKVAGKGDGFVVRLTRRAGK